jgi:U6 snRNA-associated Sm-like protein LSm4
MVLPSLLLTSAKKSPILVELKNGEAYNGYLEKSDQWMNLHLNDVICTSPDGDRFWKLSECFIRGTTIKYIRISDEVMEKSKAEQKRQRSQHKPPGALQQKNSKPRTIPHSQSKAVSDDDNK